MGVNHEDLRLVLQVRGRRVRVKCAETLADGDLLGGTQRGLVAEKDDLVVDQCGPQCLELSVVEGSQIRALDLGPDGWSQRNDVQRAARHHRTDQAARGASPATVRRCMTRRWPS